MDPQKYSAHGSELVFDMDQLVGNKNQAYYPVGGGWGASRYNCAWQMYALTYAKYTSGQDKYNNIAGVRWTTAGKQSGKPQLSNRLWRFLSAAYPPQSSKSG